MANASAETTFDHADTSGAILFADMSGDTALIEIHGDHVAAHFAVMVNVALGPGDELIKTMGDAVMVASADAPAALAVPAPIGRCSGACHGLSDALCRGQRGNGGETARRRLRDDCERRGEVGRTRRTWLIVIGRDVATAAADLGLPLAALGLVSVRNMANPMELFAVDIGGEHQQHFDPVCRLHVTAASATVTRSRDGRAYRLCSTDCADRFDTRAGSASESSVAQ